MLQNVKNWGMWHHHKNISNRQVGTNPRISRHSQDAPCATGDRNDHLPRRRPSGDGLVGAFHHPGLDRDSGPDPDPYLFRVCRDPGLALYRHPGLEFGPCDLALDHRYLRLSPCAWYAVSHRHLLCHGHGLGRDPVPCLSRRPCADPGLVPFHIP